ncbi:hypothetical protein Tco_0534489 [Tanacetum coccineum]
MSSMGELTFFLGLQVTQKYDGIFISQDKYVDEILKKFGFSTVKTASTPMETSKPLLKDAKAEDVDVHLYRSMIGSLMYLTASRPDIIFTDSPFDLEAYTDSDYAGASLDKKSTTGGCQFLRRRLISWQCKKQTIVAISTTEAEYVAASSCCGHVLWILNQMLDYGYNFINTKIFIDNESTICIVKNPVFYSKTKHIEIRHHFIRDSEVNYEVLINERCLEWNGAAAKDEIQTQRPRKAKRTTKISQSSKPISLVADETVIKEWKDRMERAATTASSLEAEQNSGSGPRCQDTILGVQKLKLVSVNATRHKLTTVGLVNTVRLNLILSVQVNAVEGDFINTSIKVAFLDKPEESKGFEQIIDFLNASSIRYALTVNPTIYTTCIEQFWVTAKVKTVNGERQIQALVDKKRVIINEKSAISDLMLEDAEGTEFFLDNQVEGMTKHKGIYVTPSHTKKVFANMKREGKGFSGKVTPLFQTMMVQAPEDMGEDSAAPNDSHSIPIITQPSSSKPQKKKFRWKQRKDIGPTEPIPDEDTNKEPISTPSCDPLQSGEDRLQLTKLMSLCTSLQEKVLDLEEAKTAQAKEIASLKKRVKQLEKRRKSRTSRLKRLMKVGSASKVESSNDVSLGAQEDASKQEKKIADLDADKEEVSAADPVTTAGEVVTTANVEVTTASAPTITIDELTLAQTLIEIKVAKPKAVTNAATITTTTRPKAKGVVVQELSEFKTTSSSSQVSQLPQAKNKGKEKMVEPEKPSKRKDQISLDKELALRLHAEEQAERERMQKEKVAQEEASRAAIIEELDSI